MNRILLLKNKRPLPKVIGKGLFQCALILSVLLSRLQASIPHVLLHRLNGHFLPVEDTWGQAGLCLGVLKTSEKCSTLPARLEAFTGMVRLFRMWLISSISNPILVPSVSIQLRRISPALSFSQVWASCKAS